MVCCVRGPAKDVVENAWEQLKIKVGAYIQVRIFLSACKFVLITPEYTVDPLGRVGSQWGGGGLKFYNGINREKSLKISSSKTK